MPVKALAGVGQLFSRMMILIILLKSNQKYLFLGMGDLEPDNQQKALKLAFGLVKHIGFTVKRFYRNTVLRF